MAGNEPTTILTLDVVRRILSRSSDNAAAGVLDLSRQKNFQLRSHNEGGSVKTALSGLIHVRQCENDKEYFTRRVKKIILSGNDLSARADIGGSLYELRVFRRSLESVVAVNCQLDSLGWAAEKEYPLLLELNLQHNYLTAVPDLTCCPRLRRLLLSNNQITGFGNLKKCSPSLEYLDLSGNHVRYSTVAEMRKDMQSFAHLSNLSEIRLEGNEFTLDFKDRYRQVIVQVIAESGTSKLKLLDGQSTEGIAALSGAFLPDDDDSKPEKLGDIPEPTTQSSVFERARYIDSSLMNKPRFHVIDHLLDQILTSNASGSVELMKILQSEALRLARAQTSNIRAETETLFSPEDTNIQLRMYEFLQKCVVVSERKKESLEPLLHVLSILSRCAGGQDNSPEKLFGAACLRQLRDFMSANEETRVLVIRVVNAELYSTPLSNLESVKNTFLPDLCSMAEDSRCPELLVGAIKYLISRLLQVVHSPGERAVIFRTFAVASRDEREDGARNELGSESVADQLLQELLENNPTSDVRIWVLETLRNLCQPYVRHGKKADSREFADHLAVVKGFHKNLLLGLSSSTRNQSTNEPKAEQLIAAEIDCLCAMLRNSRQAFADLCGARDPQLFHLLAKYFLPKVPHLLAEAATYRTVRSLLETTYCPISLREDDSASPPRYKRDILEDLQRIVLTNNVGNLLEYLREDSVMFSDAWKVATRKLEGAPDFKELRDEKIQGLFVSIIDLIAAFNQEASSNSEDGSWKLAAAVAETMNAKGRESRLFACLEVPSDVVRLAAVRCLDTVKLSEFEDDEIQHLVKMLQDVMNVSAGKTEEVIAISLNILTKLCREDKRNIFQRSLGKAAVDACLRILDMNVSRDTRSMISETEEKGVLTLACVRFLQAASELESTATYLSSEPVAMKADRVLLVEDGFAGKVRFLASARPILSGGSTQRSAMEHDPVLIEATSAGAHVDHLTKVLMEVSVSGPVAPRILRRIGNLLMGLTDQVDLVRRFQQVSPHVLPEVRNAVKLEAANEKELSESWGLPRFGVLNVNTRIEREEQHEQFMTSLCLENLVERLKGLVQSVVPNFPGASGGTDVVPRTRVSENHPDPSSLPHLLESHLMSEKERQERQTELDLGGGLRIVPIALSRAEELEAQREIGSLNDDQNIAWSAPDSTHAAARVVFASLRYGSVETKAAAKSSLRNPQRFGCLVEAFFGARDSPVFARNNLGTKFFLIAEAILEISPLRRFETASEMRPIHSKVFECADRSLGLLHKRLLIHSRLAPGDDSLIAAVMSCCSNAALQMEYIVDDQGAEMAPEEWFRELVPPSLLASAIRLLLYDMTLVKGRKVTSRNMFGELPEDEAREETIRFLSFCLRHSPAYRYSILEYLIRSNITDQFPVRRMLIQELMKRTHKLGSTQRAAIEFRLKDEEEADLAAQQGGLQSSSVKLASTVAVVTASEKLKRSIKSQREATTDWSPFAWCTGGSRKPLSKEKHEPSVSEPAATDDDALEGFPLSVTKDNAVLHSDILWSEYDIPPPPINSDRRHLSPWMADRIGSKERVVTFSFVRWFEAGSKSDAYNHVLVLSSEKYVLFRVTNEDDVEHPRRWSLLWRRPYRAVQRVAVGVTRVHILHRGSDAMTEEQATVATMLTPSRSAARELATAFFRLNQAWRAVEQTINPSSSNKRGAVLSVENANSESFRQANLNVLPEGRKTHGRQRDILSSAYFESVHICKKQGSWDPVIAVYFHDTLMFVKKDWTRVTFGAQDQGQSSALPVLMKYDLPSLLKIKYEVRIEDFDRSDATNLCGSLVTPFPALVMRMGEEELAIAFSDDLSRTVWKRMLTY